MNLGTLLYYVGTKLVTVVTLYSVCGHDKITTVGFDTSWNTSMTPKVLENSYAKGQQACSSEL